MPSPPIADPAMRPDGPIRYICRQPASPICGSRTRWQPLALQAMKPPSPGLPERAAGLPATTWTASDAVRAAGACGMIYTARSAPDRWHLVLFRWNLTNGARLAPDGDPIAAP